MDAIEQPLTLPCGLELRARVAMAPLTNTQSHGDGRLSDEEFRWLVRRAKGGFPLVSTCAAFVSEQGKAWDGQLGVASELHDEGLARLAAALGEAGARSICQLHHAGAKATVAPERLSTGGPSGARAATQADLDVVIQSFVDAALRCQRAGFDGVEIHGANGYIFTQFLAPADNPRGDAYGGSLDNRARLLRQTLQAVRAAVGSAFCVGVRISPVDVWTRRGLVLADGLVVGRWLAEDGADFIHLSLGKAAGSPPHESGERVVATAFREALPAQVPVFAAGGMWTREDVTQAMDAGVDVAVLGRAAIVHPEWMADSAVPGWAPLKQPWSPDYLRSVDVSEGLLRYLSGFAGMVEGGQPARG